MVKESRNSFSKYSCVREADLATAGRSAASHHEDIPVASSSSPDPAHVCL